MSLPNIHIAISGTAVAFYAAIVSKRCEMLEPGGTAFDNLCRAYGARGVFFALPTAPPAIVPWRARWLGCAVGYHGVAPLALGVPTTQGLSRWMTVRGKSLHLNRRDRVIR